MSDLFAAVRVQKISSMGTIRAAEQHGRRLDEASSKRVDKDRTPMNLAASQYSPDDPLAIVEAFRNFKEKTGATEGKRAAIMAHVLAIISPQLLAEVGDPRDPQNPRVRLLFEQAQAWAREEFGQEALIAARLDVDEAGAGVVDLYLCPTAMQKGGRGREPKLTISVKSALANIKAKQGRGYSYSTIQDSWANWAARNIDPRLERGKPRRDTMRQHVHADILRTEAQQLKTAERAARRDQSRFIRKQEALDHRRTAEENFLAAFQSGEVARVSKDERGRMNFWWSTSLPDERKTALKEAWRWVSPKLRNMLVTVTEEREMAVIRGHEKGAQEVEEVIRTGVAALHRGEITDVKKEEGGWTIAFTPDLSDERCGLLERILMPFIEVVAPILARIISFLRGQELQIQNYAEAVNRPTCDWDNSGPSM